MPPDAPLPPHTVRRSPRARHARLTITREGDLIVVLPRRAPERAAAQLVSQHLDWVNAQLDRVAAGCQRKFATGGLICTACTVITAPRLDI